MSVKPEELASTLVRRRREARIGELQRAEEVRQRLLEAVAEEIGSGCFSRAWLIGSLAWGYFGVRSDVDLVVEGLALSEGGALWNRLGERLGVEVDLLRLEELPERFRDRVLSEGIALHVT